MFFKSYFLIKRLIELLELLIICRLILVCQFFKSIKLYSQSSDVQYDGSS